MKTDPADNAKNYVTTQVFPFIQEDERTVLHNSLLLKTYNILFNRKVQQHINEITAERWALFSFMFPILPSNLC